MWFKFESDDYLKAVVGLNATEQGIYVSLILAAMHNGKPRPVSLTRAEMLQLANADIRDTPALIRVLETRFHLGPEGYELIRENQFLTPTEAPRADTRIAAKIERIRLAVNPIDKPTRLSGELADMPAAMRDREYKRRYRDQLTAMKEVASELGIQAPEGTKVKGYSKLLLDHLGHLESQSLSGKALVKKRVLTRQEMELRDNVASLKEARKAEQPEEKRTDLSVYGGSAVTQRTNLSFYPTLGEKGGLGGYGVSSVVKEISSDISVCVNTAEVLLEDARPAPALPGATPAGAACRAIRQRGIPDVNPSHPKLIALLAQGVTPGELADAAEEAASRGKPHFAYVLTMVENRRHEAAKAKPLPGPVYMPNGETVDELDRRIFGED